ncbi:hypothetical protein QZG57_09525 [Corynebacterium glucuronolyticum]|uniref:hypothetical protein n=1 Tax=Corynebacterium glucuronolyticum TaxID=39791 RepID=UPI003F6E158C
MSTNQKDTVLRHIGKLVNNQSATLPTTLGEWQELAAEARAFLDRKRFKQDDDLGRYVFGSMADPSWVKRRVENITIFNEGQTRRALSFDIQVPYEQKAIRGDQVAVPVTYLRKGMLINFNSADESGQSIPNLGFTDNGRLSWQGLTYATDRIAFTDFASRVGLSNDDFRAILHYGIAEVQLSHGCDPAAMDNDVVYRSQEVSRHNLFSFFAQLCMYLDNGRFDQADNLVYFPWLKGVNLSETDPTDVPLKKEVLDSAPAVQALMLAILHQATQKGANLKALEMLCILLAIASFSYLLVPLLPTSLCFIKDKDGNTQSRRTLVKISADVEINFEGESTQAVKANRFLDFLERLRENAKSFVVPFSTVKVSYSVHSARSTHLEFRTPSGTHVCRYQGIVADNPQLENLSCGPMSTEYPVQRALRCVENDNATRRRDRDEERQPVDFSQHNATGRQSRHGSYRVSQSAVHVQTITHRSQPLEYLRLRLAPDWKNQYAWAAVTAVISLLMTFILARRGSSQLDISLDTVIAVDTLIAAIYGAVLLTSSGHYLVRRTFRVPISFTGLSGFVALTAPLAFLWRPATHFLQHSAAAPIIIGITAAVIIALAYLLWRFCHQPSDAFGKEIMIPEHEGRSRKYQDRSLVAVTETGNFDCDFLHEEIIYWAKTGTVDPGKAAGSFDSHIKELREAVEK